MLEVAKVICPLHSLSRQNGSRQPLSSPLTDEMWFVSVINIIMFIPSLRSAVCQTIGDHITASSWKICPPNKRHFIFLCACEQVLESNICTFCNGRVDKVHPHWLCHKKTMTTIVFNIGKQTEIRLFNCLINSFILVMDETTVLYIIYMNLI